MKIKLNSPYNVSGEDLSLYLRDMGAGFQAHYHVDKGAEYKLLVFLDTQAYAEKKKSTDEFRHDTKGSRVMRSAQVVDGANFYIIMFTALGEETLAPAPAHVEREKDKIAHTASDRRQEESMKKVLAVVTDKAQNIQDIADLAGIAYPTANEALKRLLASRLVEKRKNEGGGFGRGKQKTLYALPTGGR